MNDKVNDAISTLMRVVPTRFSGEVAVVKAEIERLKKLAHEILEEYDRAEERVIDEVSTNRKFALELHEYLIKSWKNEINGVDDDAENKR